MPTCTLRTSHATAAPPQANGGDAGGQSPLLAIAVRISLSTGESLHVTEIEAYGLDVPSTEFSNRLPQCGGPRPALVSDGLGPRTATYENAGAGFGRSSNSWFSFECAAMTLTALSFACGSQCGTTLCVPCDVIWGWGEGGEGEGKA